MINTISRNCNYFFVNVTEGFLLFLLGVVVLCETTEVFFTTPEVNLTARNSMMFRWFPETKEQHLRLKMQVGSMD